ncbi:MAG: AMP-binding protein [Parabacteroides sp.]|nr:AMP-binding protein [Parabacteroides sp.]
MDFNLIKQLENVFKQSWNKPAFTDYESGLTFTYGDVATKIRYIHFLFEELKIKPGDKIAICGKNSTNWSVAMLAIITYRAVAVPLLSDYSSMQLVSLCEHCDAKFMIGEKRLRDLWPTGECPMYLLDIEDLLALVPTMYTDGIEKNAFNKFYDTYNGNYTVADVCYESANLDDLMLLSYTSGSTGRPKGVMLSYRSISSNVLYAHECYSKVPVKQVVVVLPMAHMFGFTFDFLYPILQGAHLNIITKAPTPKILLGAFEKFKPQYFLCVPLIMEKIINNKVLPVINTPRMQFMLKVPAVRQYICAKIRKELKQAFGGNINEVVMGGAALSKEVEKVLRMVKFPYTIGYGMTECGPLIAMENRITVPMGSCGKAASRMIVKVLSDDPLNIPGEIVTKGDNQMMGYYKNQEATEEAIDQDGWLHTGDLGIIDKKGFVYIRGRKKNMLLGSNGQNIYPEEAEDQVLTYSIFEECVVVSREGKLVGLVYVSDLTLKLLGYSRESLDLNAICKEINTHLPKYCQLSKLEQRSEEFEKTPKKNIRRFLYK